MTRVSPKPRRLRLSTALGGKQRVWQQESGTGGQIKYLGVVYFYLLNLAILLRGNPKATNLWMQWPLDTAPSYRGQHGASRLGVYGGGWHLPHSLTLLWAQATCRPLTFCCEPRSLPLSNQRVQLGAGQGRLQGHGWSAEKWSPKTSGSESQNL